MSPMLLSNVGCTWSFYLNSVEEPVFNASFPGGETDTKHHEPYEAISA